MKYRYTIACILYNIYALFHLNESLIKMKYCMLETNSFEMFSMM